jgi:mono/diheme cytochrome c family protein
MAPRTLRLARVVPVVVILLLTAFLISGCDPQAYPDDLTYPKRTDPLVITPPTTAQPVGVDPPGTLNELPAKLADSGGKVLDPVTGQVLDPKKKPKERDNRKEYDSNLADLQKALNKVFGKPARPKIDGQLEGGEDIVVALELLDDSGKKWSLLRKGSALYRRHCLQCHGLTGDGHGPTAAWVNPHPRDYRRGIFKFTSSNQQAGSRKPRKEDLKRTLLNGIEGTSMPSFVTLRGRKDDGAEKQDEDLDALIAYVIHLSLRGEVEFETLKRLIDDLPLEKDTMEEHVDSLLTEFAGRWKEAEEEARLIKPGPFKGLTKESVQNGYRLFMDKGAAGCISCHKDFGRQNNYKFDDWGTIVRPLDLTSGVYRGGRRPVDFYWRIHSGINGAGMTGFNKFLNNNEIWDLVNFLQVLPYPRMREEYGIKIDE